MVERILENRVTRIKAIIEQMATQEDLAHPGTEIVRPGRRTGF